MNHIKRFRFSVFVGIGVLVVFLVAYLGWISPEGAKTSVVNTKVSTQQSNKQALDRQLSKLVKEHGFIGTNCKQLASFEQQIPRATDITAFLNQMGGLVTSVGATETGLSIGAGSAVQSGISSSQFSTTITGTYAQLELFLQALDYAVPGPKQPYSIQRLYTVGTLSLAGGIAVIGQTGIPADGTIYTLTISGNIYNSLNSSKDICATSTTTSGG